jgi:hypothetical protein
VRDAIAAGLSSLAGRAAVPAREVVDRLLEVRSAAGRSEAMIGAAHPARTS